MIPVHLLENISIPTPVKGVTTFLVLEAVRVKFQFSPP